MGFNVGGSLQLNTVRSESQIAKKIDSWYISAVAVSGSLLTNTAGDGVNVFSRASLIVYWTSSPPNNYFNICIYGKDVLGDSYSNIYSQTNLYSNTFYIVNTTIPPKRYLYCQFVPTSSYNISSGYIKGLILP